MPSFSSTAPAFVFAAERFCPNYFSLPLLHQQYNTICRRSHFRFRNLFIIVSKSYPLTFNFPYQLLLQKLIFNLFSPFSFLICFTCEGAFFTIFIETKSNFEKVVAAHYKLLIHLFGGNPIHEGECLSQILSQD